MSEKYWPAVTIHFKEPQVGESLGELHGLVMDLGALGVEEGSGKLAADLEKTGAVRYFFADVQGSPEGARLLAEPLRDQVEAAAAEALPGVAVSATLELLEDQDWGRNWRKYFKLLRVGERIYCGPPWDAQLPADAPADAVVVQIDPGQAFGTGTHETTQLCLKTLETATRPGMVLLDIGTGSGILCIAALLLGAGRAVGMEIDDVCEENFYLNAKLNGCDGRMFYVSSGTIEGLTDKPVYQQNRPDLIACNMLSNQFLPLLAAIRALGAPTIFSGFLLSENEAVTAAVRANGFEPRALQELKEWGAYVCDPK